MGLQSCHNKKLYPTYSESGFDTVGDLRDVSVVFMWSAGDYGILEDSMGFELSFSDKNICNATRTVTG